ncbi:N-terminal phage integrase SAM-like domain-containing protein [Romboutsia sedimentorum]|uniref:N-terminal phage integrase SAM-like domain-containing protein n=1 Tax=Romboutsia sedimentorum TaxID=1368474 RepID=A0ABT7EB02_9FIRM|nr:N-terminal phage integrase SAM-like domain-containing protein [Romboutsia sedimentorum]MDK2564095.1 N-terminal phage integrase SAM-like domain-containing protein [Romboutsia sedimentorum]
MKGSVRLRKNGKWEYYFDVGKVIDKNGNPKRKKISKSGFSTEQDCRKALKDALDEFENKGTVFKDTNISMSEYMKYYMDKYVKLKCKARSIERYQEVINKHILPYFGHYYIRNIDSMTIQNFLDIKYKEGYAKSTMELYITLLKHSLGMAIHPYGFIKEDTFSKARLNYKFDYKKQRNLTKEQLYEVLDFLKENNYEYYL